MNNEMTTNNMSNKEVIEVLKGLVFGSFDRTTPKERQALDLAIKALEERTQNEWIKTSEKKPKRSGFYITTCEDLCCRNIRVCGYDAVQKKWSRGGVVAWMPKPEPYED